MNKHAINWKNFAQVELQLKFALRTRLIDCLIVCRNCFLSLRTRTITLLFRTYEKVLQ